MYRQRGSGSKVRAIAAIAHHIRVVRQSIEIAPTVKEHENPATTLLRSIDGL